MRKRRILSLLLAVAVMATMLVAVPLTASAAEDNVYVEWLFGDIGNTTAFQGDANGTEVQPVITNKSDLVKVDPVLTITRNEKDKNYAMQGMNAKYTEDYPYSTGNHQWTTGCKVPNNYGYYLTSNYESNNAKSYDVKIAWRGNSASSSFVIKDKNTGAQLASSNTATNEAITVQEFKNLTAEEIEIKFTGEAFNLYFAIKYNVPTGPTFGIEPSEIPIKVGETQNVTVNIEGYEGKTANDVEWSVPEGYDEKITFGKAQENQIPVSVSADAAGDEGRVVTATATLKDTEATAELKVEIMPADPDTLAKVYESTKFTFDEFDTVTSTPAPLINKKQNMKVHASSSGTISIKEGNNTLGNQDTVSKHLDLGGAGGKDKRSVEIIPGVDGAVTVYAGIGKDEERPLKIEQNGEVKGTLSLTTKDKVESMTAYVTAGQSVYIYSGRSGINIYAIYFKPMTFGEENGTDSGYYMSGETKNGVIRFFQSVDADDVSDYGFYIVKDDGTIVETKRTTNKEEATKLTGIYADLYGLPDQSGSGQEAQSKYSMKAFVTFKTSDTPVFAPESIKDATVDWDVHITDVMPD